MESKDKVIRKSEVVAKTQFLLLRKTSTHPNRPEHIRVDINRVINTDIKTAGRTNIIIQTGIKIFSYRDI